MALIRLTLKSTDTGFGRKQDPKTNKQSGENQGLGIREIMMW